VRGRGSVEATLVVSNDGRQCVEDSSVNASESCGHGSSIDNPVYLWDDGPRRLGRGRSGAAEGCEPRVEIAARRSCGELTDDFAIEAFNMTCVKARRFPIDSFDYGVEDGAAPGWSCHGVEGPFDQQQVNRCVPDGRPHVGVQVDGPSDIV
jgi:hypothetical protein